MAEEVRLRIMELLLCVREGRVRIRSHINSSDPCGMIEPVGQ